MILQALTDYYELMAQEGEIPRPGFCSVGVSYALRISQTGELLDLLPQKRQVQRGKKLVEIPQQRNLPLQEKRTVGVKANFLCDNCAYVLGIDSKGKPERAKTCFEAFRTLHHQLLDDVDCAEATAVLAFLDHWQPQQAQQHHCLEESWDKLLTGANLIFYVDGIGYAHEQQELLQAWLRHYQRPSEAPEMQCLVTGKRLPAARLHPSIKGVMGAQAMGVSVVSFNANAFESYGRDGQQGYNAPVSEYATFAYTTALNHLLADPERKQSFGDTTVIYWAKSSEPVYTQLFGRMLDPTAQPGEAVDEEAELLVQSIIQKLVTGSPVGSFSEYFDQDTSFYIAGLAPNAARLSLRFFVQDTFGKALKNVTQHYRDLEITAPSWEPAFLPLWKLLLETVSPSSKEKAASPVLAGAVLRAIYTGQPYPEALYESVMLRIRAEQDVSRGKAAILKACLIRKFPDGRYKEELTMSLNEASTQRAYLLGRLFAVLEKAQQDANPGINTTIKDKYFSSACATPGPIFPVLFKLFHNHTRKAEYGYVSERRFIDLMQKLDVEHDPFPAHLPLEEQGIFVLGYYHQQQAFYVPQANK